eukprot:TRINITY_DN8474_c0_g1_i1.p1 TRINITY_DN8474_c0_g1~~TRINITY_DN8474_c0_g1_i1.p1  ORF type:complete len:686 (+),score=131.55 TRINITY_DN8474_c0_g1_i1:63-2120(+)
MAGTPDSDAGDTSFMAISAALVLLMTPGLAFYYGGMVREKNILNTMMMSLISMGLVSAYWMACGFSIAFEMNMEYAGYKGLTNMIWPATKITGLLFATYQMTFAIITVALISGSLVERMRFSAYLIFITIWFFAVYCPLCYWVWGGGWIFQIGAKDFAGGTVVHISSGTAGYVGAAILGKRKDQAHTPHNVPFVILGGGLLWFGWTGFNGGSALASNWLAALAVTNTFLAAALAMTTWSILEMLTDGKPTAVGAMTGAVAGLVGITPIAGFVSPVGSLVVGVVTAACCTAAVKIAARLRVVDDTLDCFTVHGVGGYVGALLGGLLDTSGGLLYGHSAHLMGAQIIGASAGMAFSGVATALIFIVLSSVMKVRVDDKMEADGLDKPSHSEVAYAMKSMDGSDAILAAQQTIAEDMMRFMTSQRQVAAPEDPLRSLLCCAAPGDTGTSQVIQPYMGMTAMGPSGFTVLNGNDDTEPLMEEHEEQGKDVICCCCWPKDESGGDEHGANLPPTYTAQLDGRPGMDLGAVFDTTEDSKCIVAGLMPGGLMASYNANASPSQAIKQGDIVMSVNGMMGPAGEIAGRIMTEGAMGRLTLNMKRGKVLKVYLNKGAAQSVGVGISPQDNSLGICVQDVRPDGMLQTWNLKNPGKMVRPGDRIVSVNGQTSQEAVITLLKTSNELAMDVLTWSV